MRPPVLYDLVRSVQFKVQLGDTADDLRLEILRSRKKPFKYRAALWRLEFFRIQSTFPQDNGVPSHEPSDEFIWVDSTTILRKYDSPFSARSIAAAEKLVLAEVMSWASHSVGKCSGRPNHAWPECLGPPRR